MSLELLLASSRRDRLRAIRELGSPPDQATAFALRRVLFTDDDGHVRAAAARTLGAVAFAEPWLLDAICDRSPLVRDTIIRSLARCGGAASRDALRTLIETDGIWWVRRAAVYALGALAGEAELPAYTRALGDPFWRVRHAAVRVLAVLGAHDPEVRIEMQDAPPSSTLAFLRGSWGPVAVEAPARATAISLLPPALLDADPAVVTARVPDDPDVTPLALVELLCDPHATLRAAAINRLARARNIDAYEAALDWLEEPRIPQVSDTVVDLLDGLGEPALALAGRALARRDRPAGTRWAIDWVVASQAETLYSAVLERVREQPLPSLRRAAVTLADDAELVTWAADPAVTDAVATELHARHADLELAALDGAAHPKTRALQVDAAARRRDPDLALVRCALADPHPGPRAIAARWLARKGSVPLAELLADADPAVREAALSAIRVERTTKKAELEVAGVSQRRLGDPREASPGGDPELADGSPSRGADAGAPLEAHLDFAEVSPSHLADLATIASLLADEDPWVRRAAIRALVTLSTESVSLPAAFGAFADADPGVRRIACELPATENGVLARVVALTFDTDEGVRAAASEALERVTNSDDRVDALLAAELDATTRTAAYAWLVRRLDDAAHALAIEALTREDAPQPRALLENVASALGEPVRTVGVEPVVQSIPAIQAIEPTPVEVAIVDRRPFGRAGFDVAPLAISGAFDLPVAGLEQAVAAGVNLMFWESGYDLLGRFLRRRSSLRVITGTYHADAKSIRDDVERALRTLGRETLDVFLLFWTRSPARLDAAAYACLDALRRAGKIRAIGFSTHHRDLARDAIETRAWDVVMIRHSAAHPGIETELLPIARVRGTAIVTFSALTYGRMTSGINAPTPAECYRYSLAQPGVTACISAPRRIEELTQNLEALAEPSLPATRIAELRAFGTGVRAESQRFNTLLRQPTRDAAAAAREMLASEPAPEAELRAPLPTAARRSRTRLGGRRRR